MRVLVMFFCLFFSASVLAEPCQRIVYFQKTSECSFQYRVRVKAVDIQTSASLYGRFSITINGRTYSVTVPEITIGPGDFDHDSGFRFATLDRPAYVAAGVHIGTFRVVCDGVTRNSELSTGRETTFTGCLAVSECEDSDSGGDSGGGSGGSGGNCAEFPYCKHKHGVSEAETREPE